MNQRFAVVTGASGTLGLELTRHLSARGLQVLAVSRSGSLGDGHPGLAADLGDDSSIDAIRAALPTGELAIAIHAIGLPQAPSVMEVEPHMLGAAVNLKAGGFLRLITAVESRIVSGSRLVAVGGHLGIEPNEHAPLAGVANAALANLVRQLVGPLGRRDASVHLVAPGPFESPRIESLIAARAAGAGISVAEARADMLAEYPSGRMPTAADVATVTMTLLEPSASALHGSTLFLDGGARRGIF